MNKTAEAVITELLKQIKRDENNWNLMSAIEHAEQYLANRSLPSVISEQQLEEMAAELKEFDAYFDALYNNHLDKDAGNLWIAFTDKWNSFKKILLSAKASAPVSEWVKVEDGLPTEKDADENGKVLVWREMNDSQKSLSKSVFDYWMVKNCDSSTFWMPLPTPPTTK